MRALSIVSLLALLAAASLHAQSTISIVSPDSSDIADSETGIEPGRPRQVTSWVAISPLPLLFGWSQQGIPPYARVVYYIQTSRMVALGGGIEMSLTGKHPGAYVAGRLFTLPDNRNLYSGASLSYRTFGAANKLWDLSITNGAQFLIWNRVVFSCAGGFDVYRASGGTPEADPDGPHPRSGFNLAFQCEIGYAW